MTFETMFMTNTLQQTLSARNTIVSFEEISQDFSRPLAILQRRSCLFIKAIIFKGLTLWNLC